MKYTFEDLVGIVRKLRSPEGCPWDREQTHGSLKRYMLEEAYEAVDAMDTGDGARIADELGDVLLQVVLHAQIGSESGSFDIGDVIDNICRKMVRRHPHVFGGAEAGTPEEALANWEEIKKKERGGRSTAGGMRDIPRALPALVRAEKIQQKAEKSGFEILTSGGEPDKDIGQALFEIVNVARKRGLNPEEELERFNRAFIEHFEKIGK